MIARDHRPWGANQGFPLTFKPYYGVLREDGPAAICFYARKSDGVVGRVRQLCSLPETPTDKPTLLLLDIPDDGGFYVSEPADMNADAIRGFLESYASGALKGERQQLKG